jgi:hypothetical protein
MKHPPGEPMTLHAAMREFGLALMKSADELTHGAGAVAGRF